MVSAGLSGLLYVDRNYRCFGRLVTVWHYTTVSFADLRYGLDSFDDLACVGVEKRDYRNAQVQPANDSSDMSHVWFKVDP